MPFKTKKNQAISVIEIEGKFLGSLEGRDFQDTLERYRAAGDIRVVIDLSRTDFIDSSGIGALINGVKTMREVDGDIRLAGMHQRIKAVFLMTKLLGPVFELFDNTEHAIMSYEKDAQVWV